MGAVFEDFERGLDTSQSYQRVQVGTSTGLLTQRMQTIQLVGMHQPGCLPKHLDRAGGLSPLASSLAIQSRPFQKRCRFNGDKRKLFAIPGLIPIILQVQALLLSTLAIMRKRNLSKAQWNS
ncbi:MAG: hypothetical protein MZV70_17410 [Desulfobacterales bacterium]|nr:hypothetical protein [Desulfobacterales bacterium]